MAKSYVGMGYKTCPVCHVKHDEVILLDRRMKNSLENSIFMGYELCPEHMKMCDEYLAVVGGQDGVFTGEVVHIKWKLAYDLFPHLNDKTIKVVFAAQVVMDQLKQLHKQSSE